MRFVAAAAGPEPRRWTRVEYDRLLEDGYFSPTERLELVNGAILVKPPHTPRHAAGLGLIQDGLRTVFLAGAEVRPQMPLVLDPDSEPEPDLAVVPGAIRDYVDAHPISALLVVEVAETSLAYDRRTKGPLYARAGIPEYWIANLLDNVLEVYVRYLRQKLESAGEPRLLQTVRGVGYVLREPEAP